MNTDFLKSTSSLKRSSSESLLLSCRYSAENRALLSKVPEASLNTGLWKRTKSLNIVIDTTHREERRTEHFQTVLAHRAAHAKGILYWPSLLQAILAFFKTFWATCEAKHTHCSPQPLQNHFINIELGRKHIPGSLVGVLDGLFVYL